ncbi:dynein axonemal assembly factor 5 [Drosophila tropicalis]|uniref:dynein axonemal assembly factor 5 n=1 Tax=Drosophila tropicalis TaxID=46794 RepID=UPI0035ABA164
MTANIVMDTKLICQQLENSDRRVKTAALAQLREQCESVPAGTGLREVEQLACYFDELYLHLLKCYTDHFEAVRDHAVMAVNAFLEILPPLDFHLTNVMATLGERMGQTETVEPSEEIRLLYITQMHLMVRLYVPMKTAGIFRECYPLATKVLIKSIKDAYPMVQREGCATLVSLSLVADTAELRPHTQALAAALYSMLNHKHAQARVSAVEALGRLSLHMDASGDNMRRLFSEVSPLLMDSMPLVRRECGQMGILMLMELLDRYSFFERILPLVLCCLKDDSPEVVNYIRPLWVKCGKQYYDENEAELSQQEISDLPAENYPKDVERPTIGCRGLVQRSLRLLQLITRETGDWKDNVRLHSLKLLYQFVLHAEAAMTAKFFEIYPHVSLGCSDEDAAVSAEAKKVSDLMGRLLSYDSWIDHGFYGIEHHAKDSYLMCFYYMFKASTGGTYEQLLCLVKLLRNSDYSHTLKPRFQMYILRMMDTVMDKACWVAASQAELEKLYEVVYVVYIKVVALMHSLNMTMEFKEGKTVLERIAEAEQKSVDELHESLFAMALNDVNNLDAYIDENAEPILLLDGLINICNIRAAYMPELIEKVKIVFANCSDSAQVRIFSSLSVSSLLWSETVKLERERSTQLWANFVKDIVEPHLGWQAGASAEAMRSMAMATLCALAQGAPEQAREVLPSLVKHMPSLLEDRNITTRHYAIKAVVFFQGLNVEQLKPLAYATMQRMDDPSSEIRCLAALAVGELRPVYTSQSEEEINHEREVWEAFVQRSMDLLLLYHESPEKDVQAAAEHTLKKLATANPKLWEDRYARAITMVRQKDRLAELYERLSIKDEDDNGSKLAIAKEESN